MKYAVYVVAAVIILAALLGGCGNKSEYNRVGSSIDWGDGYYWDLGSVPGTTGSDDRGEGRLESASAAVTAQEAKNTFVKCLNCLKKAFTRAGFSDKI